MQVKTTVRRALVDAMTKKICIVDKNISKVYKDERKSQQSTNQEV